MIHLPLQPSSRSKVGDRSTFAAMAHGFPLDRSGLEFPLDRSGLEFPLDRSGLGCAAKRNRPAGERTARRGATAVDR